LCPYAQDAATEVLVDEEELVKQLNAQQREQFARLLEVEVQKRDGRSDKR
jgi:hypothetical protein